MSPKNTKTHAKGDERLRFETLIADLSSRFVNLPAGEVDREIMDAQRRICELLDLDLLVLWQLSDETAASFTQTHLYSAQEGPLHSGRLNDEDYPWFKQELLAGRIAAFSSLAELPAEAARDRESFRQLGTKSNLSFPLSVGGGPLIGAFCLNAMRAERDWPQAQVKRLSLVAQVFANALARKRADKARQESEEVSRATFEQAAVGIAHVGTDGHWLRVNDKLCNIVGFPREELLQLAFRDITHPDDLETDLSCVRKVLSGEIKTYSMEKRFFRKDRSIVWVTLAVSLVRNAAGEPQHFISVVKDITDRKRAEEALRTSEQRLAAGTELAGLGSYEIDYTEPSTFADDRFGEICGVSSGYREDLQRLHFWIEHLHPDDSPRVLAERQKMYEGKVERYDVEYRYLHPAQGQKWLHHLGRVATRDATGRVTRVYGVVRDITERKRLSEQLQSVAEEWKTTFDSINDLVMILDPEFRIIRANTTTARFLGLPMEKIVGSACFTLMHGTSCPIPECPCRATYQANLHSELELFHAGSGKWLLLSTDPIQDAAGNVIGAVHVGRDITEAKRAEAELLRQRTELAHIARVSTMGELAASMAHELNQPLGAILANAETAEILLKQEPPALDDMPAILAAIRRDNERASEVIRRMRSMFRKRELEHQPLEINSLVQDVLRLIGGDAALRGVSIAADLAPALPQVCADRVHLQQVLVNLIINGMDAMASQPRGRRRISVHTRLGAGSQVELAVVDSGSGVEPDKLPRLFEPFYTTKADGMGMGLSIARTIVEVHGGRLWAENNSSGGAVFRILLPAGGKMQVAEAGSVRSAPPSTKAIAR